MCTKTCKKCGWVFPASFKDWRCNICGEPFDEHTCVNCGELKPHSEFLKDRNVCMQCWLKYKKGYWNRHLQKLDDQFDEWLAKVRSVPANYPSLTEEQWLAACRHFDGCARCSSKDIDTRGFFVGAKLGGRYCDWNIIPLCEKCASNWNLEKSAFKYIEKRMYQYKKPEFRDGLAKIIDYLGGKLDNAATKTKT